jgi:predicted  nucleic acid-binding Zn-ribbon protein
MSSERETSNETVVTLLNQKIDQLIEVVTEIKNNLTTVKDDIRDLQLEMRDIQNINNQQQKEIDEQKQASKSNKAWLMGIASGLIVAVVGALLRAFMGV